MGRPSRCTPQQRRTLARLKTVPSLGQVHLEGGTAIALRLGHRESLDLDLFGLPDALDLDAVGVALGEIGEAEVVARSTATLKAIVDKTPVDFVRYPYPLVEVPDLEIEGFPVASLRDLAAAKLSALARRGLRRDFWDIYAMDAAGLTLEEALASYRSRYRSAEPDSYHVLRALTFFDDAERDPRLPSGMSEEKWQAIKAFFRQRAHALVARK